MGGGGGQNLSHGMRIINIKAKIILLKNKRNLYICDQVV